MQWKSYQLKTQAARMVRSLFNVFFQMFGQAQQKTVSKSKIFIFQMETCPNQRHQKPVSMTRLTLKAALRTAMSVPMPIN